MLWILEGTMFSDSNGVSSHLIAILPFSISHSFLPAGLLFLCGCLSSIFLGKQFSNCYQISDNVHCNPPYFTIHILQPVQIFTILKLNFCFHVPIIHAHSQHLPIHSSLPQPPSPPPSFYMTKLLLKHIGSRL